MDVETNLVLAELQRIGASKEFRNKPVMQELLKYLVTEHLEGRSEQISGFSIGVDVFGRAQSTDPTSTALVRNNALRLRRLLETYYLGDGKNDLVHIDIPKGKYIPKILRNDMGASAKSGAADIRIPTAAVLPFRNFSANAELDYVALGFSQELSDALTAYEDIRIIGVTSREPFDDAMLSNPEESTGKEIEYLVDGELRSRGQFSKISIRLLDAADRRQIWSSHYGLDTKEDDLFEVQEKIARLVASHVGGDFGQINQNRLRIMRSSRPRSLAEQDILLRQYSKNLVVNEQVEREFNRTLVEALAEDPDSALLNALVAGNYGGLWQMGVPGVDDALDKVAFHAEKAYSANPAHQIVLGVMSYKCFLFDEKSRFFELYEQAKDSLPNSPMRLGGWAIYMSFFGEWERGKELIDRILDDNVNVPGWLHGTNCIYYYRLEDYESALVAANKYHIPGLFWGPVSRIATLGQLGRTGEAEADIKTLWEWRPDFADMGRTLFGRMFKEESLIEHLVEGLEKAGLKIA